MVNAVTLVHSLPGRTRFNLQAEFKPAWIEYYLRRLPQVKSATYNQITKNILIYHDTALSVVSLKKYLRKFCLLKQEKTVDQSRWGKLLPLALSTAMFLTNWYIQRNPFSLTVKGIAFWAASLTSILTSIDVIKDGITTLFKTKKANANTLTTTSILASLYTRNPGSALVIAIMSTISEWLTEYTSEKTKEYIHSVMKLDVPFAWKVTEQGEEEQVPIDQVQKGDVIVVYTGEKIPADGIVSEGQGRVDESSLTGEYMPKEIGKGQPVYAGSILQHGQLTVLVEKAGKETALSQIVQLLEEAQERQAPIQNLANKLSEKMVPVSFGLAILTLMLTRDLNRAMNMLVIDFICGIKLSTATALYAAIGKAAKQGVIIKGSNYIEDLSQVETIILDKTGTITEGKPVVQKVVALNGYKQEDVIQMAAIAEKNSSHPIAEAVLKQAKEWKVDIPHRDEGAELDMVVGKGIATYRQGKQILVGSLRFMKEMQVKVDEWFITHEKDENYIFVAYNKTLVGAITIFDRIRAGMHQAIQSLRLQGIQDIIMLTGDKRIVAKEMAKRLKLNWYHAETLPEDKADYVKQYRRAGKVMMVGDGINDAPALAHANIGVTMGAKRTDIASEASDIIITSDNPKMLPELVKLSTKTMAIIKQNFFVTFLVNGMAILLGALGMMSPITGAAVHNAATIGVVLNSARILWGGI